MSEEKVLILDFGSQYTQLIARRIRESKVYCEIHPYILSSEAIRGKSPQGIVLSGGPASVYDKGAPKVEEQLFHLGIPVLGICYGMQLMASLLGGDVVPSKEREYGEAQLEIVESRHIFAGLEEGRSYRVWMSHGDRVEKLPPGFMTMACSPNSPIAAMGEPARALFGLQFHPEVVHTEIGGQILRNFLFHICQCHETWDMRSFVEASIERIKAQVGEERVICALSGGVDSSVVAALVHKAIGDKLTCIFVDNGFLRNGEAQEILDIFRDSLHLDLRFVDARKDFLNSLRGVEDPEQKRKVIGGLFITIFEREAEKLGKVGFLVQGTLYPDVIESVSFKGPSATIKSHHNVGGLPERMRLKVIEPLRELFKDEVRRAGEELGLPDWIVHRQPFPGPGLAVRVIGEVTEGRLEILRKADAIVQEEITKAGLYREVWQAFAVLLPIRTVGVMGDERTYEHVLALRVVSSLDGMTADWVRLPYELLTKIANRIINEVKGVNRVVYDISSKPPSTIEWE
ncbi:MAG: glutamine-hydrolyzing GMP synthase [Deltaproteobacteria bacterium]|nr:MAG: glutamine-hydrolyzing GMP synthase [Deltaproteobacteria bacterium]